MEEDSYMERSKFLKEISSMTREQINEVLERNCKRVKKVYPVVIVKPELLYNRKTKTL